MICGPVLESEMLVGGRRKYKTECNYTENIINFVKRETIPKIDLVRRIDNSIHTKRWISPFKYCHSCCYVRYFFVCLMLALVQRSFSGMPSITLPCSCFFQFFFTLSVILCTDPRFDTKRRINILVEGSSTKLKRTGIGPGIELVLV